VPVTTVAAGFGRTKNSIWLSPEESSKSVEVDLTLDNDLPVFVNVQQTGFYR
jgi:hypothetical protein